jgi:formate C-acetyltransferase
MREEWTNFAGGKWESDIDVRDFIQRNYTPYDGDQSFLEGPTEATDKLWASSRNSRRKKEPRAAFLIWKLRL